MLSAEALEKSSRAAFSHGVVDSGIEDVVHNDVRTNAMMTLVPRPAETVNEVDRHSEELYVASSPDSGAGVLEVGWVTVK